MKSLTFRKGIHPHGHKEATVHRAFIEHKTGDRVYIPLSQHIGAPARAVVAAGDYVKMGTLIGEASGYVSANVHSSVSGKVVGIEQRENVQGRKSPHVVIENDHEYTTDYMQPLVEPSKEEIIARCKEAGIVGMGGATFPTHVKLETKSKITTLIINGSECEPYITTDYRMMLDMAHRVLAGISYIKKALGAEFVEIGIEDNKAPAIERMRSAVSDTNTNIRALKTKYPQGGEKQLIYAITKKKVPNGGLPSDLGFIVLNISTAYAVYEAVSLGKPTIERYMTLSGGGIKEPCNIHVKIGIPFDEIVSVYGINKGYVKAVSGGPMMGISMSNLRAVSSKGSSALLLLNEDEIRAVEPSACINCGRCHKACPINLMPMMTDALVLKGLIKEAKDYNPMSCIECGCCSYVCPAKRPLVQSQRLAKKLIREKKL